MKRVLILIVFLLCMCICLSSCGEDTGTNEEVIEGYSEKTVLRFVDSYAGAESEIQDLFADGNNVYCAVTDRRSAGTVCYRLSDGVVESISSINWVQTKNGAYDTETGGYKIEIEDADLINSRDIGFAFLPEGAFIVVGHNDSDRTLTVYSRNATAAEGINGYGLPVYENRFEIGRADDEGLHYEVFMADDHTAVLVPVSDEGSADRKADLVDVNKGSASEISIENDQLLNGFFRDGLLFCCTDGELKAIDIRTAEPSDSFEPFKLEKKDEESVIRVIGVSDDNVFWIDGKGIHAFSVSERKNRLINIDLDEYKAEDGWTVGKACVDRNDDIYLQVEKKTNGTKETSLVCCSRDLSQDIELNTLKVTAALNGKDYCDERGIHLTKIITDRFQPDELWNEGHTFFTDAYQLHLHAYFDDPVIRPDCTVEGCDHQSPSCEAWKLGSEGNIYELSLGDSILCVTQLKGDMNTDDNSDPRFPNGSGLLIERKKVQNGQLIYETAIPDVFIGENGKLYYDGRYLIFAAGHGGEMYGYAVYVFDVQTGEVVKEILSENTANNLYISESDQIILSSYVSQKGILIDTDTWQCSFFTGIIANADWYNFIYDGSSYTAEPLYDAEYLDNIPNPYGLDHSQIFLKNGEKALVRFSDGYRDEIAIIDLDAGEVLYGTVPMKNEWGEDIPIISMESDKYYVYKSGAVWNSRSFPAPPDYFDGLLNGTYRYVYAFIEKEAFWNGETNYTVFEMPS